MTAGGMRLNDRVKHGDSEGYLNSRVKKRSLVIGGHRTSVTLEDIFWIELRAIARERHIHLSQLADAIDSGRHHGNLSSAIRLFVFEIRCTHAGHRQQQNKSEAAAHPGRIALRA